MMLNHDQEAERRRAIWAQVCSDYYQPALDFAVVRLGNMDVAFDAVQDSTVRLLRLLPDPARIEDPRNYWIKTVHHRCTDLQKQRTVLAARTVSMSTPLGGDEEGNELPPFDPPDRGRGPAMNAEINEQTKILLRELESQCADLTERERALLALRIQGLVNEQIASARREDLKVIKVDMNKIMAKMRYRVTRVGKKEAKENNQQ